MKSTILLKPCFCIRVSLTLFAGVVLCGEIQAPFFEMVGERGYFKHDEICNPLHDGQCKLWGGFVWNYLPICRARGRNETEK